MRYSVWDGKGQESIWVLWSMSQWESMCTYACAFAYARAIVLWFWEGKWMWGRESWKGQQNAATCHKMIKMLIQSCFTRSQLPSQRGERRWSSSVRCGWQWLQACGGRQVVQVHQGVRHAQERQKTLHPNDSIQERWWEWGRALMAMAWPCCVPFDWWYLCRGLWLQ